MIIHIPEEYHYRVIITILRLKPDPNGKISFFKQFGNKNQPKYHLPKPIVDPLLIHAELSLYPDERLKETAKRLYRNPLLVLNEFA